MRYSFVFVILCSILGLIACETKDTTRKASQYKGPLIEITNVNAFYSDSGKVKVNLRTPLQQEYKNEDRVFPKGLTVNFYDAQLQNNGRLVADSAFYSKKEKLWTAVGNVVVTNLLENKSLLSDTLHWNTTKKIFYTSAPIKITSPKDKLAGKGIEAQQDLKRYQIGQPKGIITVKQ
ncbi:LPS export ABC transporter periplasmic protein LptC [Microscilla marina]|uniref:Lipoprotein, putative n=1 Tax=Microscilla marina ATCC 23134 TaxID=313606 RepID=A1ZG72_MICM2|nr:LPS export ABC transporter periplasmic protein LptC [Microscilla marina]EAY30489.1 lipoprotein, putative [Microscilla marina ATCC 23134]